jgi:hypothetical protein
MAVQPVKRFSKFVRKVPFEGDIMAAPKAINFTKQVTPPGTANIIGQISLDEIADMPMPEFLQLESRLMNVRKRKRRDVAVYEKNTAITTAMTKEIFRKGVGADESFATSATEYIKNRWHTNMPRGGDFGEGSVTIVKSLEVFISTFALVPTTFVGGAATNLLGLAALTLYDPGLVEATLVKWAEIGFYRGETLIVDGLAEEFPAQDVVSGVAGAAVGALFQNGGLPGKPLENPEVLVDNEDFHVLVSPLHALDMTSATGLNLPINVFVKLSTTELRQVYS